jgi:hypothetical protein
MSFLLTQTPSVTIDTTTWNSLSNGQQAPYATGIATSYGSLGSIVLPNPGTPPLDIWGRPKLLTVTLFLSTNASHYVQTQIDSLPVNGGVAVNFTGECTGQNSGNNYDGLIYGYGSSSSIIEYFTANTYVVATLANIDPTIVAGTYNLSVSSYLYYGQAIKGSDIQSHSVTVSWDGVLSYSYSWSAGPDPAPATPVLSSPANNAANIALPSVALTWNAAQYASNYDLQVASDSLFTSIILNASGIGNVLTYTLTGLTRRNIYYWRVRARSSIIGSWSSPWSFTTPDYGLIGVQMIL